MGSFGWHGNSALREAHMVTATNGENCLDCAFFDGNATEARRCVNSPECDAKYREAVGGDSVHFVEVE